MKRPLLSAALALLAAGAAAKAPPSDGDIDRAVVASLASTYGMRAKAAAHVDLIGPFGTRSQWTLVVAKDDPEAGRADRLDGAVSACFVKGDQPDCSDAPFLALLKQRGVTLLDGERPLHELYEARVVHADASTPLLSLKACTANAMNGDCAVMTVLYAYDAAHDRFRPVFSNMTGRNNNQETRFIDSGPLQGAVVVATPTYKAPFVYELEVYRLAAAHGPYRRTLRHRGHTVYGDGNPLSVIDSEMPALLGRLGHWKAGDALPVPPVLPAGCTRLYMRKGVEWCGSAG